MNREFRPRRIEQKPTNGDCMLCPHHRSWKYTSNLSWSKLNLKKDFQEKMNLSFGISTKDKPAFFNVQNCQQLRVIIYYSTSNPILIEALQLSSRSLITLHTIEAIIGDALKEWLAGIELCETRRIKKSYDYQFLHTDLNETVNSSTLRLELFLNFRFNLLIFYDHHDVHIKSRSKGSRKQDKFRIKSRNKISE